jgi:hypothetical protein
MPGILPGGRQALIGIVDDLLTLVIFSQTGNFEEIDQRDLPYPDDGRVLTEEQVWEAIEEWKQVLGFTDRAIAVESFSLPDLRIGISDLPDSFQRFLRNPDTVEHAERRAKWEADIEEWNATNKFILRWGDDYWMDAEGNVYAT